VHGCLGTGRFAYGGVGECGSEMVLFVGVRGFGYRVLV